MPSKNEDVLAIPETVADPPTPWYRKAAQVFYWPLVLPILLIGSAIFLAIGLYMVIHIFVWGIYFHARMWLCGRFLRWRRLRARIAAEGPGTLIIETPTLGWGFASAWWTPDKILAVCPYAAPTKDEWRSAVEKMQCLDWDRWHWEKYTDPNKGRGILLRPWTGQSFEKWVRRNYPSVDVVHTWTALVHYPNAGAELDGA